MLRLRVGLNVEITCCSGEWQCKCNVAFELSCISTQGIIGSLDSEDFRMRADMRPQITFSICRCSSLVDVVEGKSPLQLFAYVAGVLGRCVADNLKTLSMLFNG